MANTKKYVSLDKLGLYNDKIKEVIADGDAAALKSAKDYADSLATNYDAAGTGASEAAKVQAELDKEVTRAKAAEEAALAAAQAAQGEVDALELVVDTKAAQADLTALAGKVGEVPADKTVMGIINEIQENAYDDTAIVARIKAVEDNKADKTQVATDIAAAVKVEEEARIAAVKGVQDAVDGLAGTHATDKAALEDAIAEKADQTALDAVSQVANAAVKQADYDVKVKALDDKDAEIIGLVEDEAERAAGVEAGLDERLEKVEAFFEGAAEDAEGLQNALDTLVEIQTYVDTHGEAAAKMVEDIAANAKAIEDHEKIDHDFAAADATLKSDLEGKINAKADATVVEGIDGRLTTAEGKITTVEGKVSTLEGKMTTVEGAVATKAEQSALEEAIETLEGVDTGLDNRLKLVEAQLGDGENSVAELIEAAKQEAIDTAADDATAKANAAKDAAIAKANELNTAMDERMTAVEAASATHAKQADLEALAGRVTTAEGDIDTLEGKMTAVEALAAANKLAHEANAAAIAKKASQDDLDAVSGRVTKLETWHADFVECSQEDINGLFD